VLQRPQTGAVDELGRIYVTDSSRSAVFLFDSVKGTLRVWAEAEAGINFSSPVGIVMGKPGEVLVSDSELALIFRLSREGRPLGSFGHGILSRPTGMARDPRSGWLFVADTRAHDVKVFDENGELIKTIGVAGEEEGEFNAPTHMAFFRDKLYVTDTLNARVQIFDQEGRFLKMLGKRGNFVGNMVRPKGVAADIDGNIYVVESLHDHLLVYDANGEFLLPIGGTGKEVGSFFLPSGVWTDRGKKIYVSDMFNGRVMIFQYLGGG
ncbi:MAG: 6-bladed beta-propeller, partial [Magnetococcales bacterium]|nr:6-bladed beta-propeller [Magnetococcales bacterium]